MKIEVVATIVVDEQQWIGERNASTIQKFLEEVLIPSILSLQTEDKSQVIGETSDFKIYIPRPDSST